MEQEAPSKARSMRVEVTNELWEVIEEVAVVMRATPKWCFQMLIDRVGHLAVNGQADVLGFEFTQALRQLNNRGRLYAQDAVPAEAITKLHRSAKAKSGFVGVYSNGNGFRAEGKDPKTGLLVTLGTFPSAEAAAYTRYQHYRRHNLGYGKLAELMDRYREREELCRGMSEERLKHEVIWSEAANLKRPIEGLTDEERALETINPYERAQASSSKIGGGS